MTTLKNYKRFMVIHNYSKCGSESTLFETLADAEASYAEIAKHLLSDTYSLDVYHWRNNDEGLSVELRELRRLPESVMDEISESETQEERDEIWNDNIFTYSDSVKTTYTILGDEFDEDGRRIIEINETNSALYSSLPFSEQCLNLLTGEKETAKGGIE